MRLFKKRSANPEPVIPTTPIRYPSGVCVETEAGRYYLKGGRKYKIKSDAIFKSWSFPTVCKSSEAAISKYVKSLKPLGFRDGTVVRNIFNSELFIISNGKKIKITDPGMFEYLGLMDRKISMVSPEDIGLHADGDLE